MNVCLIFSPILTVTLEANTSVPPAPKNYTKCLYSTALANLTELRHSPPALKWYGISLPSAIQTETLLGTTTFYHCVLVTYYSLLNLEV